MRRACWLLLGWISTAVHAEVFPLETDRDLIGEPGQVQAEQQDTLPDLARQYHLGFDEISAANPGVDVWLPKPGTMIRLPTQHLLPDVPHVGLVVNLPDGRLYYFHDDAAGHPVVETYPISVGKMDWKTPLGVTRIVQKEKNPTWYPPASVRESHLKDDPTDVLPPFIPPGPDNPLGAFALRLAVGSGAYMIHGTNKPVGVGMQITHGCIRLYPEDIETLFREVSVGMPVRIINQRIKTGWADGALYLEVHHPLDALAGAGDDDLTNLTRAIVAATAQRRVIIDWDAAQRAFERADGFPVRISIDRWLGPAAQSAMTRQGP
ncbi:MAG TPA: L,D-transpeptidase family protein [Steroidobacteraceae bacterium]|nr:L,D-transpeptidase family protein [Steroidobacteraceae bacterium]